MVINSLFMYRTSEYLTNRKQNSKHLQTSTYSSGTNSCYTVKYLIYFNNMQEIGSKKFIIAIKKIIKK